MNRHRDDLALWTTGPIAAPLPETDWKLDDTEMCR